MESILNFRDVTESFNEFDNIYNKKPSNEEENLLAKNYPLVKGTNNDDDVSRYEYDHKTINVNFATRKLQMAIISRAPWNIQLKTFLYFAFCQKHQAIKLMGELLAPNGLHGMYIDLVKNCHEIIIEILEALTDKSNLPVLIHCKHGKDRTGIVIAIILSLLGIPDELIIKDYLSSLKHLQPIQSKIVKDLRRMGLPEEFSLVNYEAMKYFLDYVKDEYSSTSNYLIKHGFSLEKQNLIIQNLTN
ncbi:11675_t:CDS:2 [Entrophospora sp. SA101]|nr:8973_t:CDS:2 [Entrophospora sp. SA101]CAJ0646186.1 6825_t:CDS:2 [Entrophospora sp. SA101]CAJ0748503.1 11675_t:CDS:2 [Entrophospora sp. SA101]CAJ0826211.1 13246_t:CDS:2 [Entrophospora sp. SA101]CAJ0833827.1 17489_t:CDS:2 [Entrophospora sp. SA101]